MSESWRAEAACIGVPESVFFIERGQSDRPAKAICAGCPVKAPCLQFALDNAEQHGVWGGTSERQRRKLRLQLGITQSHPRVAECGTYSGAYRHRKRGEALCEPCRLASIEYTRNRRARLRDEGAA